ncbi:hypothetical protein JCM5353_002881 [Sporobolomyces roseus]
MFSQLSIALSLLLSTALAAPLESKLPSTSHSSTSCSPNFTPPISSVITSAIDSNYGWLSYENGLGSVKNVSIANLFDIDDYNKIHATNNYVVTPIKGTKNQYHFVVNSDQATADQPLNQCLAPDIFGTIRSSPCISPLSSWTVDCTTCANVAGDSYAFGNRCLVKSTVLQTCATVTSDGLIALRKCSKLTDLPPDLFNYDSNLTPEQLVGTQSWDF